MHDETKHIALQQYANYVRELTESAVVQDASSGISNYVAYVARFMLAAMRARQRYGQEVTFDDMISSCAIMDDFFRKIKFVSCSVRIGFAKALMHMVQFLLQKSDFYVLGNSVRKEALETARRELYTRQKSIRAEQRLKKSMEGVAHGGLRDEKYCVIRAVIDHQSVDDAMNKISTLFEKTGFVTHTEYNFVMGAVMVYIVFFNAARNEVIYKMRYGSIWPGNDPNTGLQEHIENENLSFWVGRYPSPKNIMQKTASTQGGTFVLDEKSRRWQQLYDSLRKWLVEYRKCKNAFDSTASYFLLYTGKGVSRDNTKTIMKNFFKSANLENFRVSSGTVRRSTASKQYRDASKRLITEGAHPDAAALSGHTRRTQVVMYSRSFVDTSVLGYTHLGNLSQEEASKSREDIEAVTRLMKIKG
ncbi:hypothetical protein Aduo_008832 [Ancylostoma duodenale]